MKEIKKISCVNCEKIADFSGNYVECVLLHRFVDWYYWRDASPEYCPKKNIEKETKEKGE